MRRILNRVQRLIPRPLLKIGQDVYGRFPLELRYGKVFKEASEFLGASQSWSAEEHAAYQLRNLQGLVAHAYGHVPFYRDLYRSHGVRPEDITQLSDIRNLPLISKDDLREHLERMKTENFPASKFQYHTTGGSTGKPVGLYWEADRTVPLERAFMRRQWRWGGFEMERDRSVVLRGVPLAGGALSEHAPGNQLRLSTYDLTSENIDRYIEIIRDFKPKALQAYPSAAYILAQHVLEHGGAELPSLEVVLCGSENLYPWQREMIGSAFNCRVYSWYGHSEYIALGGECEYSSDYHFYTEYGVTEFLDKNGKPAAPGETGEIVATGFNNRAMPLIRYRTEDIARVALVQQCRCGRHYPLVSAVEGRLQEMIVGRQGNLISMTAINMHNDIFDNVYQFQFYQDTPGAIVMRIVRKKSYSEGDEMRIRGELREKLRDHVDLAFEYVDAVAKTPRGKVSFLVQKLKTGFDE